MGNIRSACECSVGQTDGCHAEDEPVRVDADDGDALWKEGHPAVRRV